MRRLISLPRVHSILRRTVTGKRASAALTALLVIALVPASPAISATPTSGNLSQATPLVTWSGAFRTPNASSSCATPANCDNFALTINPPASPYLIQIRLDPGPTGDWDLEVYSSSGVRIANSGESAGVPEAVILKNLAAGTYSVRAAPFAPANTSPSYTASATLEVPGADGGEPVAYANHSAPSPLGRSAGEPSLGVNFKTNKTMFIANTQTLRVCFDDCTSPAVDLWENKSFLLTNQTTADPILFVDQQTGRTFVSQLAGPTSLMAFSDDDGENWTPSQGAGFPSGVDHQTVGGGHFHAPLTRDPSGSIYPNAVYYCSQDVGSAQCARSDNGGLTFGAAVPIYTAADCGGLHGSVQVAPDGTVYVPNKNCAGQQAVVVSEDNGLTWSVRKVPGTGIGVWDPFLGVATDGTIYLAYGDSDGHPKVAVSSDRGRTWKNFRELGATFGIKNASFPVAAAGDGSRAAVAFLGTTEGSAGAYGTNAAWPGAWYLYVAHTYDGGLTWTTVSATPGDPVQRGPVCSLGTFGCTGGTRNLLDFNDATLDREGRFEVGYADGCIGACITGGANSATAIASIARQLNGRRLLSAFDGPAVPSAPSLKVTRDESNASSIHLSWSRPDDRGSAITGYNIYRRPDGGDFALLTSVAGNINTHDDTIPDPGKVFFYKVTAVNASGEGSFCREENTESRCVLPGLTVLTDVRGDATTNRAEWDIDKLSIAEPAVLGPGKIAFVLKMGSMANPSPDTTWPVVFKDQTGADRFVRMSTNALGAVSFASGTGTNPSAAGVPADPASSFTADGTIKIVVSRSAIGNPAPGQMLTQFQTRIRVELAGSALTPDNMPDNTATRAGTYTVLGSENCGNINKPPVARDDLATTDENQPVIIDVLANDSDPEGEQLTVTNVTQAASGSVTNNGDGTVTYNPNLSFNGDDSFTYTISDPHGATSTATVKVTVNPFCPLVPTGSFKDTLEPGAKAGWAVDTAKNNLGPASPTWQVTTDAFAKSARHSWFSDATTLDLKDDRLIAPDQNLSSTSQLIFWHRFMFENTFDGGVLEVSSDKGGTWVAVGAAAFAQGGYNGVIATGFGSPIAGRAAWTGNSQFVNATNKVVVNLGAFAGFKILVRWRLAADPLAIGSLPGSGWWVDDVEFTNTLQLSNCNRPPVAKDDEASTTANTPVTINVLANDVDPDGDTMTVDSVTQGANGSVVNNGTSVTYTPNAGYVGANTFTYKVTDGKGHFDTAGVEVFVTEQPNRAPDAVDDTATTQQDTPVTIPVLGNDTDPDNDPLTITGVTDPAHGAIATNSDGTVTYTPELGFFGTDAFSYTITDGRGGSDTANVAVTVERGQNFPPDAVDDTAATEEGTPITIAVLANDSDPNGDPITISALTQPSNGSATDNGNGTITYRPNAGFMGSDSFTYTITDGRGGTDTARVTVTVTPGPGDEHGMVTGGGSIPESGSNGKANFGFNAQISNGVAKGRVTYDSNGAGISLKGSVDALRISGKQGDFSGTCELGDGTRCTYQIRVKDNAEPGTGKDQFRVQIFNLAGTLIHEREGVLSTGNIQIHK